MTGTISSGREYDAAARLRAPDPGRASAPRRVRHAPGGCSRFCFRTGRRRGQRVALGRPGPDDRVPDPGADGRAGRAPRGAAAVGPARRIRARRIPARRARPGPTGVSAPSRASRPFPRRPGRTGPARSGSARRPRGAAADPPPAGPRADFGQRRGPGHARDYGPATVPAVPLSARVPIRRARFPAASRAAPPTTAPPTTVPPTTAARVQVRAATRDRRPRRRPVAAPGDWRAPARGSRTAAGVPASRGAAIPGLAPTRPAASVPRSSAELAPVGPRPAARYRPRAGS